MKYWDVVQGQDDWWNLRRGAPTASEFGKILTPKKREFSGAARSYIGQLISERISDTHPQRVESYTSRSMEWGQIAEEEARQKYSLVSGYDILNGGFCMTDDLRFGASPDGLVSDNGKLAGALELKCPEAKTHMRWLLEGGLPLQHKCQIHGELAVTGLPWVEFFSYSSGCPDIRLRIEPDDFTMALRVSLERFWKLYLLILEEMARNGTDRIKALYLEQLAKGQKV